MKRLILTFTALSLGPWLSGCCCCGGGGYTDPCGGYTSSANYGNYSNYSSCLPADNGGRSRRNCANCQSDDEFVLPPVDSTYPVTPGSPTPIYGGEVIGPEYVPGDSNWQPRVAPPVPGSAPMAPPMAPAVPESSSGSLGSPMPVPAISTGSGGLPSPMPYPTTTPASPMGVVVPGPEMPPVPPPPPEPVSQMNYRLYR